jgi:ectoine hydroxylase-related dioxygenase (phytanoyl-CoA dioxygenase family)
MDPPLPDPMQATPFVEAPRRGSASAFDAARFRELMEREGFYICEDVISAVEVERLKCCVQQIPDDRQEVRRKGSVYGVRNLLEICPEVRGLASQPSIRQFIRPILGRSAFAVRAVFFDKAPGANWSLGWHQDNVVSVRERLDAPGFVGWSRKAGVWHVQPPAEILAGMIAIRVHLDDSGPQNGPLRVLPGSHRCGWIEDLDDWKRRVPEVACRVGRGGVVVMRPLTLHASAPSVSTEHRRVIHIEYANGELPYGLVWNNRVVASVSKSSEPPTLE